ncbi:MAG TPA: autotransporter domain-containing protein, partial [Xanthobacteraceae bacterium]|nr:autotransporter domain-containing protein [Xanthobacteraceae bacterium]
VKAGGTLAPGDAIGMLTINGNLVLGAGAIFQVQVAPAVADRTNVTGTANIAGSTLSLLPTGGTYTVNTKYTLLFASGGLTGSFASVSVAGAFGAGLRPSISFDANDVFLTLAPELITPMLMNGTRNELSVAGAIDTTTLSGQSPALFQSVLNLPAVQLNRALDALSGEVHASTVSLLADESSYARSAILGRLRQASYGGEMGAMAALRLGGPQAFAADGSALMTLLPPPLAGEGREGARQAADGTEGALAYAGLPVKAPLLAPQASSDIVFWAQGFGAWGRFSGDGNAAGVSRDLAGFISGVDTRVGTNGRVGFAAGYTSSQNNTDGRGSADIETGHVAAYGGWSVGALNLRGGADLAFHTIATDRTIAFPGFFDRAFSSYDGATGQIFGELGYGFALANLAVEPFAGAAFVSVHTDSGSERALLAGLNFASANFDVGYSTLGVRAAALVPLGNGMVLIPRASLAWQHAFGSTTASDGLAFQAAPNAPFTIAGVPIARDAALVEAGLDLALNPHATIGVSYTGQLAGNVTDNAAKGKFSWKF